MQKGNIMGNFKQAGIPWCSETDDYLPEDKVFPRILIGEPSVTFALRLDNFRDPLEQGLANVWLSGQI